MRLICTVKFVPDVDKFDYDYEKNKLLRDNIRLILNPDDACALAFALQIKALRPDTFIEVVTMGPRSVIPHLEDLLRLNLDRGVLISDPLFAGSDTYITSKILHKYLGAQEFDCLLTGSHTLDGDTSHVPAQLAELLDLPHLSTIIKIDQNSFSRVNATCDVEDDRAITSYEVILPAVLSLQRESRYKLPYPRFDAFNRSVRDSLTIIDNRDLGLHPDEVGLKGSLTKVVNTYQKTYNTRNTKLVRTDDDGIEYLFRFLKDRGYLV